MSYTVALPAYRSKPFWAGCPVRGCSERGPDGQGHCMVQPGPDPDSLPPIDPTEPVPDDPGELSPDTPETLPPAPVEPMPGPDDPGSIPGTEPRPEPEPEPA